MAITNIGHKGIDVRQTGNGLAFRFGLLDSNGDPITTAATIYIAEVEKNDATISLYTLDFTADGGGAYPFTSGACTQATASSYEMKLNNNTVSTGLHGFGLTATQCGNFTAGAMYIVAVYHASASPKWQWREFQYGSGVLADLIDAPNATALAAVADALLNRDMSIADGGAASTRTVLQALRVLRNKVSITGGVMTITKENDTTASWTAAVTTDAAAYPVTSIDPT